MFGFSVFFFLFLFSDHVIESNYPSIFFATYRTFATPQQLLNKLIQKYQLPPSILETRGPSFTQQIVHDVGAVLRLGRLSNVFRELFPLVICLWFFIISLHFMPVSWAYVYAYDALAFYLFIVVFFFFFEPSNSLFRDLACFLVHPHFCLCVFSTETLLFPSLLFFSIASPLLPSNIRTLMVWKS